MNEQRLQAYYQLIQSLLNCPSGEETVILAANTELLDAGFLLVLEAVADVFVQQGEQQNANWLRSLARQLKRGISPITPEVFEAYEQFLLEVLQAIAKNNGDAKVVYPLLAANSDKLNETFAEVMHLWATKTLAEAKPNLATFIAAVINDFSNLIQQFSLGSKADNIEIAITGYEIALTVFTQSAFPVDWAMTQNNLGNAYGDKILGERAENIEFAIKAYKAALSVFTRSAFPEKWATTQNNLGTAYSKRILGEQAENIEFAIKAYKAALEVKTKSAFPEKWATTQNNLGIAYSKRILGEPAENIENAIAAFSAALEVRTKSAFPQYHAETLLNFGILYQNKKQFNSAYDKFNAAIETVEALRGEIVSGEEAKRKQAEE